MGESCGGPPSLYVLTVSQDAEDPPADTSPNVSNILPEADQAPSTSIRLLGRRLQNGSILPLPGALGLDSFQAAAVGEESIRGRFSDRVERPQDIYQVSRARQSFWSSCSCRHAKDASQSGIHLDATLINQVQDSQPYNSLRSAPGNPSQQVISPSLQRGDPVDREQDRTPGTGLLLVGACS